MALSHSQAVELVKEAYMWGYPVVDNYRVNHQFFIDKNSGFYMGPFDRVLHRERVLTSDDRVVQLPNSDTLYSVCAVDLRTDGFVLTVPKMDRSDRYYSVQLTDWHCFNSDCISSRTVGTNGGNYLLVGPSWTGDINAQLPNINKVIRIDTDFCFTLYRTQLFNFNDLENVRSIQAGYLGTPYKVFCENNNTPSQTPISPVNLPQWMKALTVQQQETNYFEYFRLLNFVLTWVPIHPTEKAFCKQFQDCGLIFTDGELDLLRRNSLNNDYSAHTLLFNSDSFSKRLPAFIHEAFADAVIAVNEFKRDRREEVSKSQDLSNTFMVFGDRKLVLNRYKSLERCFADFYLATVCAIYGQVREESIYPAILRDSDGELLSGAPSSTTVAISKPSLHEDHKEDINLPYGAKANPTSSSTCYEFTFQANALPPVDAFWSLTLYTTPDLFFYPNTINRWLLNSTMMDDFVFNKDGSLTFFIQHAPPLEHPSLVKSNWLPAPEGNFELILRCFAPKPAVWDGTWRVPEIINTTKHPEKSVYYRGSVRFREHIPQGVALDQNL
jgi:hypothetical protein